MKYIITTALLFVIGLSGLCAQTFTEHTIKSGFNNGYSVFATDLDGDGDIDVLGASKNDNDITWWENDGSENFTEHVIRGDFDRAWSVYAIDLDGDGDMDVLGASEGAGAITWWENDGNETFTEHTITSSFGGATSVYAADVDGDGDLDVLGTARDADQIAWWENDGSENFSGHILSSFNGAHSVYAADVDGDGDMDILGAEGGSSYDMTWWENDGSESFTEHTIATNYGAARTIYAADVDNDGDMDILGAGWDANEITWWENDGSENFSKHIIGTFYGSQSVYATDVDGDGDMDALGTAGYTNIVIAWCENDGSENFTQHTIGTSSESFRSVYAADIDSDGDMDVLGVCDADDMTWWENDGSPSSTTTLTDGSSFSPSVTQGQPNQVIGRFQLTSSSTFSLIAAKIKLNTTRSGASDFRLWQSSDNTFNSTSDIQLGDMVEYDPGTGSTVSFSGFASPVSTSGTYYFLTCDIASDASGDIQGIIVNNSSLNFSGGTLSGTINNAALSGGDVSLPVELASFTAESRNGNVLLKWVTESEIENMGFILERSDDNNVSWCEIASFLTDASLKGQGSTSGHTEYTFTDNTVEAGHSYYYRLSDVSFQLEKTTYPPIFIQPDELELPKETLLKKAYPNPFNPITTLKYNISKQSNVTLTIYNMNGQVVEKLVNQNQEAGFYSVIWDATKYSSGVYFYHIKADEFQQVKKCLLVK